MHFFASSNKKRIVYRVKGEDRLGAARGVSNGNPFIKEVKKLRKTLHRWKGFFTELDDADRMSGWIRLEIVGGRLCEKYSWAIPDARAIRIIKYFSPTIEIGAGKGYWCKLLRDAGADVVAFDKRVSKKSWTEVRKGGPEILDDEAVAGGRSLLLCYPDEQEELSVRCLEKFVGSYIIHIGEMMSTGQLSSPQAPWGRTSCAGFQIKLAEEFHCVLVAELPRFPFSKDCISVWKRTEWVRGKESIEKAIEQGECAGKESDVDDDSEIDDGWASIPSEETLPNTRAAPFLEFLLTE